jgi:hypothetical protein
MVVPVPDPLVLVPPGVLVNVQVPVAGKLLITTLPVETAQVGCVILPAVGAGGGPGISLITITDEGDDVHPEELVTV